MRRKIIIITALIVVFGTLLNQMRLNYPLKLDYKEIEYIKIENDNPPFECLYMDTNDVELFIKYYNETKFVKCESNITDELVGEGIKLTITFKQGEMILYSLKPYFEIDSIWYKCDSNNEIYKIINKYK